MAHSNLRAQSVADVLTSNDDVADFFREELNDLPHRRDSDLSSISTARTSSSMMSTLYSLRRSFSRLSLDSIDLEGVQTFDLGTLCDFIADHPSLKTAGIISCSCYTVPSAVFFVPHRFLVLQLRREGRRDVWLRLDRLRSPSVSLIELALTLGTTPSNDRAMLASSPEKLQIPTAVEESRLAFTSPYPLSTLRLRLLEIVTVMDQYKLTSENCWAFCSLLLTDFTDGHEASFHMGQLHHSKLSRIAKRRLSLHRDQLAQQEYQFLHDRLAPLAPILSPHDPERFVPFSIILRDLRHSASKAGYVEDLDQAIEVANLWEASDEFGSTQEMQLAGKMVSSLSYLETHSLIYSSPNSQQALQVTALCRHVAQSANLKESFAEQNRDLSRGCISLLHSHGERYLECRPPAPESALPLFADATSMLVPGVTSNILSCLVHYRHAMTLHILGRADEAKTHAIVGGFIDCIRHIRSLTPWRNEIRDFRDRRMLPIEFDYLVDLEVGDLPKWNYWHKNTTEVEASDHLSVYSPSPSPSPSPPSSPVSLLSARSKASPLVLIPVSPAEDPRSSPPPPLPQSNNLNAPNGDLEKNIIDTLEDVFRLRASEGRDHENAPPHD